MNSSKYILVINPGSTSTKIAIYLDNKCISTENISHDADVIKKFVHIVQQKDMRTEGILNWLQEKDFKLENFAAVVGRGGLLRPMPGGTYKVTYKMLDDLVVGYQGQHASNLGGIIAFEIAEKLGIPSYIVDPVAVDEVEEVTRISGLPEIPRRSLVHALNIKAVVRKYCTEKGVDYDKSKFVVAHIGGGITISPVSGGRILDCNNANHDGPLSPQRTGGLPAGDLVEMAYSKQYTQAQIINKITREGGLLAYLGTDDGRIISKRIDEGDKEAEFIFKAMAYQISKEIGAMSTALMGKIDAVILTGGMAYNQKVVEWISENVSFIAPVEVIPGENEMQALAEGAQRVLNGEEEPKVYEEEVIIN